MTDVTSFVLARIGASRHLLELSEVREIIPAMSLSLTESASGRCRGVANVRGSIVPVFDLLSRKGLLDPAQLIVVAGNGREPCLGLLVDDVLEILQVPVSSVVAHAAGGGRRVKTVNLDGTPVGVLTAAEVPHGAA